MTEQEEVYKFLFILYIPISVLIGVVCYLIGYYNGHKETEKHIYNSMKELENIKK